MSDLPKPRAKGAAPRPSMYEQNRLDEQARQQALATAPEVQPARPAAAPVPALNVAAILADEPNGRLSVAPITQSTLNAVEDVYIEWKRAGRGVTRYAIVQAILDEFIGDPELQARVARRMKR